MQIPSMSSVCCGTVPVRMVSFIGTIKVDAESMITSPMIETGSRVWFQLVLNI